MQGERLAEATLGDEDKGKGAKPASNVLKLQALGDEAARHAATFITGGVAAKTLLTALDQLVDGLASFAGRFGLQIECHSKGRRPPS